MSNQVTSAGESGYDRQELSSPEEDLLRTTVDRKFRDVRFTGEPVFLDKLKEYMDEVMFTAEVARAQFDSKFDGGTPRASHFGIDGIHPNYFAYTTWSNVPDSGSSDAGTELTWIDDSVVDNLSGSGGRSNPLVVGEDIVHLILGVELAGTTFNATKVKFVKNDSPRPSVSTFSNSASTAFNATFFDSPIVLAEDDEIYGSYVPYANSASTEIRPLGVSFLRARPMRGISETDIDDEDIYSASS